MDDDEVEGDRRDDCEDAAFERYASAEKARDKATVSESPEGRGRCGIDDEDRDVSGDEEVLSWIVVGKLGGGKPWTS